MIHGKVFRLASVIAQAGEEEIPLLEALCTAAEAQTAQRLREGCTAGDCGDAFCCAAAMLAAVPRHTVRTGQAMPFITSYSARPSVTEPPGLLMNMVISFLGSSRWR